MFLFLFLGNDFSSFRFIFNAYELWENKKLFIFNLFNLKINWLIILCSIYLYLFLLINIYNHHHHHQTTSKKKSTKIFTNLHTHHSLLFFYHDPTKKLSPFAAAFLGMAVCAIRKKDNKKKILQMFPDDDIRETIINYADGAGEENTVI